MDWYGVGHRIRKQREFLGYTRERFAELIEVTPKFCSDIELGLKGMSIPTLCRISNSLNLSVDYILFGTADFTDSSSITLMLQKCPADKLPYMEQIIKNFLLALNAE